MSYNLVEEFGTLGTGTGKVGAEGLGNIVTVDDGGLVDNGEGGVGVLVEDDSGRVGGDEVEVNVGKGGLLLSIIANSVNAL